MSILFETSINAEEDKHGNRMNYANRTDDEVISKWKKSLLRQKGFFIQPSHLFKNVLKRVREQKDFSESLDEELDGIFRSIEASYKEAFGENSFSGLFVQSNFRSDKLGSNGVQRSRRIREIMEALANVEIDDVFLEDGVDVFGTVYEFLMYKYASASVNKAGEFYTPPDVSHLVAKLAIGNKKRVGGIYDPTCGSGSLLFKCVQLLKRKGFLRLCGQEVNTSTYNLCRMNLFLRSLNYTQVDIRCGNTLLEPDRGHLKEKFEVVVANPPFSLKNWYTEDNYDSLLSDNRFAVGGLAPKQNADFAFIQHCLSLLDPTKGKAVLVCSTGVFWRLRREKEIRRSFLKENFIESVVFLSENLFPYAKVSTALLVLSKQKSDKSVLFVDARRMFVGIPVVGEFKKRKLSDENLEEIFQICENRVDVPFKAKLVPNEKIINDEDVDMAVEKWVEEQEQETAFLSKWNILFEELCSVKSDVIKVFTKIESESRG